MIDFSGVDRRSSDFRIEIPEKFNFARDVLDARASREEAIAIRHLPAIGAQPRAITYHELSETTDRFCGAMQALGLGPGDHAVVLVPREPAWHEILLAAMKAGVVTIPSTVLLTPRDIVSRINRTGAKAAFATPDQAAAIEAARAECPSLRYLVLTCGNRPGWHSLDDWRDAKPGQTIDSRADDPAIAYFTSGTTSAPKLVLRDHGYGLAHAITGLFWMDLDETSRHWVMTDTGWAKAAWGMLFPQLLLGAEIFLLDGGIGFDPDALLPLFEDHEITSFCAPPTVYRLFAQEDLTRFRFPKLRRSISAGEPMNPEAIRTWQAATGNLIADGYGQTESINLIGNQVGMEQRIGSVGKPMPGLQVDIVDDDGQRCPDNAEGQIAVRMTDPPPPGLFNGYVTDDGINRDSFRYGWYYSGDTARRDEDGYIWFIGRADDVILSAAYRISPFEVESTLLEHPSVVEAAVVGKPDPLRGQIVAAFVVLAADLSGSNHLVEDIQEFCKAQSAPYKYPREIHFVPDLPKTVSGKIRRVDLRNRLAAAVPSG